MDNVPSPSGSLLSDASPSSIFFKEDTPPQGLPSERDASPSASLMGDTMSLKKAPSETLEADNEASPGPSLMTESSSSYVYRPPSPCWKREYDYLGERYDGQTDTFIIASNASHLLKEADPPIPCVLWGIILQTIFEDYRQENEILSIDLVVEDEQIKAAIETLRKAGFRDEDKYPGCPYSEGAYPDNELKPFHVFHLFDLFAEREMNLYHGYRGPRQHHDLRIHRKSDVLWRLPKFTVQTEINEEDENFMPTLDHRLHSEGVHRPRNHPPTRNPLILPTPARLAEALINLKKFFYVGRYGDLFKLDPKKKTLSETCREWWESCRLTEYKSDESTKLREKLEKELSREVTASIPATGVPDEPETKPLSGHWGRPAQQSSPSILSANATDSDDIFPFSESDKAIDST
ncbi:hypothetical protein AbraCBS73388_003168 [Aspergillus brasiliensis]|uniref:Uncharacterized protein n=1 Tax=Aspergillus brasiliensis TaxID=319629 RepID=A0A9W5Z1W5_9EURO|nr:hypothetical protein AbraCBS73388_003168 [Aspergillus brasiliensis]